MKDFQCRSEETGLSYYETLKEAFDAARKDSTIWKISFAVGEERVRLVFGSLGWMYENIAIESSTSRR